MFVTLIIGVLIAIAIAVYVATIPGAEAATCRSNQRMLEEGAIRYNTMHGSYPTTLTDLGPDFAGSESGFGVCPSDPTVHYDYDPATGDVSCPLHP